MQHNILSSILLAALFSYHEIMTQMKLVSKSCTWSNPQWNKWSDKILHACNKDTWNIVLLHLFTYRSPHSRKKFSLSTQSNNVWIRASEVLTIVHPETITGHIFWWWKSMLLTHQEPRNLALQTVTATFMGIISYITEKQISIF